MTPQLSFERTPVTLLLMASMAALEIFGLLDPPSRVKFYNQYLGILPSIWNWGPLWQGEFWRWPIWRPFTTTLLHGDPAPFHAIFNIYILALFGSVIEGWLRWPRMLLLVVFLAFASTLPEFMWANYLSPDPDGRLTKIVGFSGVNYGLFGLLWVGRRYRPDFAAVCSRQLAQWMIGWFFLCILLSALKVWSVANVAHGAGLGLGALMGLAIFRAGERWRWWTALVVAAALVLAMLLAPGIVLRAALAILAT